MSEHLAEPVHDGVLGSEGGIVGVGEDVARGGAVNHEGAIHVEDLLPLDFVDLIVELVGAVGLKFGKGLEDGKGGAAGVVGAVKEAHVAGEGDGTAEDFDVLGTEFAEFVGQDLFKSHHGFGNHLEGDDVGGLGLYHLAVIFLDNHWRTVFL